MSYIDKAIQYLVKNAQYSMDDNNYNKINWMMQDGFIPPTSDQIIYAANGFQIQDAITSKKLEVTNWKNIQAATTIQYTVNGTIYNFQKDSNSKISMILCAQNQTGMEWVTYENVTVELSKDDINSIILLIANFETNIVTRGRRMKNAIESIPIDMSQFQQTLDAINNFDIQSIL